MKQHCPNCDAELDFVQQIERRQRSLIGPNFIRGILALVVVVGGGYLLATGDNDLRMTIVTLMTLVLTFYFGTSQGSDDKNVELSRRADSQAAVVQQLTDKVAPTPGIPTAVTVVNPSTDPVKVSETDVTRDGANDGTTR